MHVHIIDESLHIRNALSELWKSDGCRFVTLSASWVEAEVRLRMNSYDLVIVQATLPDQQGWSLLNQVFDRGAFVISLGNGGLAQFALLASARPVGESIEGIRKSFQLLFSSWKKRMDFKQNPQLQSTQSEIISVLNEPSPNSLSLDVGFLSVQLVAIGVSTGGPQALAVLLAQLPQNFAVPIVIVQHLPKNFAQTLAESLSLKSTIPVVVAGDGEVLTAGKIYLAEGGRHLEVVGSQGVLKAKYNDGPLENNCKPSVDVLFRSVAKILPGRALGVVLTGMGSDGCLGAALMRQNSCPIFAQDEQSCVVWGMPRAVIEAKLATQVLSLNNMASSIVSLSRNGK